MLLLLSQINGTSQKLPFNRVPLKLTCLSWQRESGHWESSATGSIKKMVSGLKGTTYEKRLCELGLTCYKPVLRIHDILGWIRIRGTFWRYMYIIFKDKKSNRSHKEVGIKVFLTFFAWWWKDPDPDPDPYLRLVDPDPGGPKTCRPVDPDSDPQHCYKPSKLFADFDKVNSSTRFQNVWMHP